MARDKRKAISRSRLYQMVEDNTGYRYDEIRYILDVMWTILGRQLCQHRAVRIPGFGLFEPFHTNRRRYRGFDDKIYSTERKWSPKFRASTILKGCVESGNPEDYLIAVEDDDEEEYDS